MILIEHFVEGTPTQPITLAPLGDIQWAGRRDDLAFDHLTEHVQRACSLDAKFLGTGDYIDFASPSNRETFRTGHLYDNARRVVDDKAKELTDELVQKVLAPTAGRWLGLVSGHHYFPLKDGRTTDMYLAEQLGAQFLGEDTALVRLTWSDRVAGGKKSEGGARYEARRHSIDIWIAHGKGAGQSPASPMIVLDRVSQYFDADVYIMGHQTKKCYASANRVVPAFPTSRSRGISATPYLTHRSLHLVGAGGWTRGYVAGQHAGTYVEKALMRPVTLGAPLIHIRPRWRDSQKAGFKVWDPNITVEG